MILTPPTIILIRPQLGENIGAAARAAKNFGLSELRLVAPRDGWPNDKARDMAAGAVDLIDNAAVFATPAAAVADCHYVLATTARERDVHKPVVTPRAVFSYPQPYDVSDAVPNPAPSAPDAARRAILFGPERTGLTNEDVALADAILSIPTHPAYPSLNLAQAVAVVAYEWFQAAGHRPHPAPILEAEGGATRRAGAEPATKAELQGLFAQLEAALDAADFWRVDGKKPAMWRNIRAIFQRAGLSAQEVRTLRGVIRTLRRD